MPLSAQSTMAPVCAIHGRVSRTDKVKAEIHTGPLARTSDAGARRCVTFLREVVMTERGFRGLMALAAALDLKDITP